ncbi:transcriptional regulator [Nocardioides zeae]|nr:transcriptional regulator [Nocardioides zeae]
MHVRPWSTVESALRASDDGIPDAENAKLHGVALKTIRRWRRDYQRRSLPRGQSHTSARCPRCENGVLDVAAYAELLGWYLGDGHLVEARREVLVLTIVNDQKYVEANARLVVLMRAVKPGGRPHVRERPGAIVTAMGWKHWTCLFPQHGPGRKHDRGIVLEPWQRAVVEEEPAAFLRGLFHSDGSRVRNWASRRVPGTGEVRRHDYARWQFSNRSEDLLELCGWALDLAGVPWRRSSRTHVSVSRRAAVARLDTLIGVKR